MTRHNGRQLLVTHLSGNTGDVNHRAAAATVERKQIGRPTDYTPEIAREIADRMIDGNPLRAICQQKDMPDEGTVTDGSPDTRSSASFTRTHESYRRSGGAKRC